MKHILRWSLALVMCCGLGGQAIAVEEAVELNSLRGDADIAEQSLPAEIIQWQAETAPLARDYVQQPPLIPHHIEGYEINLKVNKCLTCHSWANYKAAKATKISPTHFRNRDGVDLANVSAQRYFCTQCHVPQANAQPLVENTFESVDVLQPR